MRNGKNLSQVNFLIEERYHTGHSLKTTREYDTAAILTSPHMKLLISQKGDKTEEEK